MPGGHIRAAQPYSDEGQVANPVILLLSRNKLSIGTLFTTDDGTDPEIKFELKIMKSK